MYKTALLSALALTSAAAQPNATANVEVVAGLRGALSQAQLHHQRMLANGDWYFVDQTKGQNPWNVQDMGNGMIKLKVAPDQEAVSIHSKAYYNGGKFEVAIKSAAAMPGIITAVYAASDSGRTSDEAIGTQDEIDLEFKGNDPYRVQTNVFLAGAEDLQLINIGSDTSKTEHVYGLEWDTTKVVYTVDGAVVRQKWLPRPLAPMRLSISLWTTMGGWPGLKQWGGETDWSVRNFQPIEATFNVQQLPY